MSNEFYNDEAFGTYSNLEKELEQETKKWEPEKELELSKVTCNRCGKTIIEHDKDKSFLGVDICAECFIDYIDQLIKEKKQNKKLNVYED